MCGNDATSSVAQVACRELNHAARGLKKANISATNLSFIFIGLLFVESFFDVYLSDLVPIQQTNMMCNGNESSLSECTFDGLDGDHTCTHEDDAIVFCIGMHPVLPPIFELCVCCVVWYEFLSSKF